MCPYYNPYHWSPYREHGCGSRADCPEGTQRINNYYKGCAGVVLLCKDACYDPFTNHYSEIGPLKSCGVCVGVSWPF